MMPLPVVTGLAGAAVAFAAAWSWQANHYTAHIANMQRDQAVAAHKQLEKAHAETIEWQTQADAAARQYAARASTLADAVRRTGTERDRLRSELAASAVQLPDAACATVREHAAALNAVFGECADTAGRLAQAAGGHAIDTLKLLESWPER